MGALRRLSGKEESWVCLGICMRQSQDRSLQVVCSGPGHETGELVVEDQKESKDILPDCHEGMARGSPPPLVENASRC